MVGLIITLIVDCVLMITLACTAYDWNGIFVIEGILSGIGFCLADEIWSRKRGEKK